MFSLAPLTLGDELALEDIHGTCFPNFWRAQAFKKFLEDRYTYGWKAIDLEGYPLAFILTRVVEDEAEILTFAVSPAFQRKGVGRKLLMKLLDFLSSRGCHALFLEVALDNMPAISLYKSLGFIKVGVRPNYYLCPHQASMSANVFVWKNNSKK